MTHNIILYSTHCPKCLILERKLKEKDIEYVVETDTNEIAKTGFRTVPLLSVDGDIKEFSEAINWIRTYED